MDKYFSDRATRNYTGLWLSVIMVVFVVGWRLLVVARDYTSHWREIAAELGSLPQFVQDLSPNSAGTRLIYCRTAEKGVGIYFCDTGSNQSKLLCEQDEKGYSWQRYCVLGWSPGDKLFAYALPLKTHPADQPWMRNEEIVVCDGLTGETVTNLGANPNLYQLAWLSARSFVYSTDFNYSLRKLEQKPDGQWVVRQIYENFTTNKMENLTAIADESVAWQESGNIWTLDFQSSQITKIWDSETNQIQLVDFTYSRDTGEYLLNCWDAKGQFLIRFSPATGEKINMGRIGSPQDFVSAVQKIDHQPEGWVGGWKRQGLIVVTPRWVDGGSKYAYKSNLREMGDWGALFVKSASGAAIRVPWSGFVDDFALQGDDLFFTGSENGKVPGIWEFNITSETCRCILGGSLPLGYARISTPCTGVVTNESGDVKPYFLWPPVKVTDGKKCPLIITKQFWNWFPYDQIAANEGYYFAIVDQSCELALDRMLARNPGIDTNRVYLYESSGGAESANELIAEHPDLWKGAILFGADWGPDLSAMNGKKLLIVDGTEDENGDTIKSLAKYEDSSIRTGVPTTVAFLKDSGHMPNSIFSERTRAETFAEFLAQK